MFEEKPAAMEKEKKAKMKTAILAGVLAAVVISFAVAAGAMYFDKVLPVNGNESESYDASQSEKDTAPSKSGSIFDNIGDFFGNLGGRDDDDETEDNSPANDGGNSQSGNNGGHGGNQGNGGGNNSGSSETPGTTPPLRETAILLLQTATPREQSPQRSPRKIPRSPTREKLHRRSLPSLPLRLRSPRRNLPPSPLRRSQPNLPQKLPPSPRPSLPLPIYSNIKSARQDITCRAFSFLSRRSKPLNPSRI